LQYEVIDLEMSSTNQPFEAAYKGRIVNNCAADRPMIARLLYPHANDPCADLQVLLETY
jgi:hypothetical protein